jgi:hypothetical protein
MVKIEKGISLSVKQGKKQKLNIPRNLLIIDNGLIENLLVEDVGNDKQP